MLRDCCAALLLRCMTVEHCLFSDATLIWTVYRAVIFPLRSVAALLCSGLQFGITMTSERCRRRLCSSSTAGPMLKLFKSFKKLNLIVGNVR